MNDSQNYYIVTWEPHDLMIKKARNWQSTSAVDNVNAIQIFIYFSLSLPLSVCLSVSLSIYIYETHKDSPRDTVSNR